MIDGHRVMAIDPGARNTGWSVVDRVGDEGVTVRACGVFVAPDGTLKSRVCAAVATVLAIADEYGVDEIAVEEFTRPPGGGLALAMAFGAALGAAFAAAEKATIVRAQGWRGHLGVEKGDEGKGQVEEAVRKYHGATEALDKVAPELPPAQRRKMRQHAADAIGIAVAVAEGER